MLPQQFCRENDLFVCTRASKTHQNLNILSRQGPEIDFSVSAPPKQAGSGYNIVKPADQHMN